MNQLPEMPPHAHVARMGDWVIDAGRAHQLVKNSPKGNEVVSPGCLLGQRFWGWQELYGEAAAG